MRLFCKINFKIDRFDRAEWLTPVFDLDISDVMTPVVADAVLAGAFGVRCAASALAGATGSALADAPLAGAGGAALAAAVTGGRTGKSHSLTPFSGRTGRT